MKVDTYCAACGRPAQALSRKALADEGWTVAWSRASQALFVECAACSEKWRGVITPEVMNDVVEGMGITPAEHPMQHRRLYRVVPLALFVVARGETQHVLYAWEAAEAARLARQEGWFRKSEPIEVREFRWV